mmetsp:Transcript_56293/g.174522  ORF Transcript_56293/g.174522 Transcript_56293/m.174522 type:complete len:264 (+) Transcript_56293:113-904(+)
MRHHLLGEDHESPHEIGGVDVLEHFSHGLLDPRLERWLGCNDCFDSILHFGPERGSRPRVVNRVTELYDVPQISDSRSVGACQELLAVLGKLCLAPVAELFVHGETSRGLLLRGPVPGFAEVRGAVGRVRRGASVVEGLLDLLHADIDLPHRVGVSRVEPVSGAQEPQDCIRLVVLLAALGVDWQPPAGCRKGAELPGRFPGVVGRAGVAQVRQREQLVVEVDLGEPEHARDRLAPAPDPVEVEEARLAVRHRHSALAQGRPP